VGARGGGGGDYLGGRADNAAQQHARRSPTSCSATSSSHVHGRAVLESKCCFEPLAASAGASATISP
jgi:hypothetical protein